MGLGTIQLASLTGLWDRPHQHLKDLSLAEREPSIICWVYMARWILLGGRSISQARRAFRLDYYSARSVYHMFSQELQAIAGDG